MKIGLIYGTDTGYTEQVAAGISGHFKEFDISVHEIKDVDEKKILSFDFIIFGAPTWYVGELQSDWEDYFEDFKKIDFSNKLIALFGLGDQYGYDDNFVDAIGKIGEVILKNNGEIIGEWSTEGYEFENSLGLKNEKFFYGLAIDEDNQFDLTEERIKVWSNQLINHEKFKALENKLISSR